MLGRANIPGHAIVYVQCGCGSSAPEGWLNFDASLRVPLGIRGKVFPRNVRYGDIVRGLPIKDGTAKAVYASHILEHLIRVDSKPRCETPGGYLSRGDILSHHARSRNRRGCLSTTLTKRDVGCQ